MIALPLHQFCLINLRIYPNFDVSPLIIQNTHILRPSLFYRRPNLFFLSQSASSGGVQISPIEPHSVYRIGAKHIQLRTVAICTLQSQNQVAIRTANILSVILENIIELSCGGISQEENIGVPQSAAEYCPKRPAKCAILILDHRRHHRPCMWKWRHQTWNHQSWLMYYLLISSGSASTPLMVLSNSLACW